MIVCPKSRRNRNHVDANGKCLQTCRPKPGTQQRQNGAGIRLSHLTTNSSMAIRPRTGWGRWHPSRQFRGARQTTNHQKELCHPTVCFAHFVCKPTAGTHASSPCILRIVSNAFDISKWPGCWWQRMNVQRHCEIDPTARTEPFHWHPVGNLPLETKMTNNKTNKEKQQNDKTKRRTPEQCLARDPVQNSIDPTQAINVLHQNRRNVLCEHERFRDRTTSQTKCFKV